jgi:hypothetical protein
MENKSDLINAIAASMRSQALQTDQSNYSGMMNRLARSLEDEANRLTQMRFARSTAATFH